MRTNHTLRTRMVARGSSSRRAPQGADPAAARSTQGENAVSWSPRDPRAGLSWIGEEALQVLATVDVLPCELLTAFADAAEAAGIAEACPLFGATEACMPRGDSRTTAAVGP